MADPHKNFAYSHVATAPSPATTGISLIVTGTQGSLFPTVPFNATVWPAGTQPTSANAEIVRVTNISSDTFTLDDVNHNGTGNRQQQEGSSVRTIGSGDQIAAVITAKTLTDIEANYANSYAPIIAASAGTAFQTLASNSSTTGTGSLFVFPMTIQYPIKFNQLIMANSLSYMTTATGGAGSSVSNTYYSFFGLYSLTGQSLSLISSNSFGISETFASVSLTWSFPTTTATAGYGYGTSFNGQGNFTDSSRIVSYISGLRAVGLQFGGEMSFSAGIYWLGLLSYRSTAGSVSSLGLSHAGFLGHAINAVNMAGTASGLLPLGVAAAEWAQSNASVSGWNGRFIMGFMTNTAKAGFAGTAMPNNIPLIELQTTNTIATVLPLVTFVST